MLKLGRKALSSVQANSVRHTINFARIQNKSTLERYANEKKYPKSDAYKLRKLQNASAIVTKDVNNTGESDLPDFHNVKVAFKGKPTLELFRAYTVFTLCSIDKLIDNQAKVLKWTRQLLGRGLFRALMKATFYGQFEGGETTQQIQNTAKKMVDNGIIPMFAYTAAEVHGLKCDTGQQLLETSWRRNYDAILKGLEIAAGTKAMKDIKPKLTGKVTFHMSADSLRRFTDVMIWNEKTIQNVLTMRDSQQTYDLVNHLRELSLGVDKNLPQPTVDHNAGRIENLPHLLTRVDFNSLLLDSEEFQNFAKDKKPVLEPVHRSQLSSAITSMREIAKRAADLGVTWVIDAEQTYLQPAIDAVTLDLMRQFNKNDAAILNTYQCYLKRTMNIINRDLKLAQDEGFCFGVKLVRGAYIDEERRLAKELGYEDPINPTYEATSEMYHNVSFELIDKICSRRPGAVSLIFATHNEDTVKRLLQECHKRSLPMDGNNLMFAQLFGMRDYIAYAMGHCGLPGGKLIHYGDIEEGVAYLSRRLMENRKGVSSADIDREIIGRELRRRIIRV